MTVNKDADTKPPSTGDQMFWAAWLTDDLQKMADKFRDASQAMEKLRIAGEHQAAIHGWRLIVKDAVEDFDMKRKYIAVPTSYERDHPRLPDDCF